jgi:hypothetical protein
MMRWITHSSSYLYMSVYFILSLDTKLFSSVCGKSHFYTACRMDELPRGSILFLVLKVT